LSPEEELPPDGPPPDELLLEEVEELVEFEAFDALELSALASPFVSLFVSLPGDEGEGAAGSPEPFFFP
jgi:hypothetical protein